jgi:hypothetical protein
MAGKTGLPWYDDFTVPRGNLVMAEDDKVVELSHLVDLCGMVALMAVDAVMNADDPGLVRKIMDMTDRACIRIVLEIIIDFVCCVESPQ